MHVDYDHLLHYFLLILPHFQIILLLPPHPPLLPHLLLLLIPPLHLHLYIQHHHGHLYHHQQIFILQINVFLIFYLSYFNFYSSFHLLILINGIHLKILTYPQSHINQLSYNPLYYVKLHCISCNKYPYGTYKRNVLFYQNDIHTILNPFLNLF